MRLEIERFTPATVPSLVLGDVDLALIGASQPVAPSQRWFRDLFLSGRALSPQIRALLRSSRAAS